MARSRDPSVKTVHTQPDTKVTYGAVTPGTVTMATTGQHAETTTG